MHIVMLAAENGSWAGGKVGGLGDVIRDLPQALVALGHQVSVITPGYGLFVNAGKAERIETLRATFSGNTEAADLYRLPQPVDGLDIYVIEHPMLFENGPGRIYTQDDKGPFATDSHRFALFSALVAQLLLSDHLGAIDVVHCHDWHLGPYFLLRQFSNDHSALRKLRTIFSIHNLSLQGIRPFREHWSSPQSWFPGLQISRAETTDPIHTDCINLMRTSINLADAVNTVSPTYAEEITRPSQWQQGIAGGDGLEKDLRRLAEQERLLGILNGCDYSRPEAQVLSETALWKQIETDLDSWVERRSEAKPYYYALQRLGMLRRRRKPVRPLLTAIGRLTFQKLGILVQDNDGNSVMSVLLKKLEQAGGVFILLGDGDPDYDAFFLDCMRAHDNFLYLRGYSETLADQLYATADLFVMPSVFEPCGISQLMAMRAGTPCVVHATGGLADTVEGGVNGFSFNGEDMTSKVSNLLATMDEALAMYATRQQQWQKMVKQARATRFEWADAARTYVQDLYNNPDA